MTILVGCSGWSYDDWVGRFYPLDLARKRGEWLRYYAEYFRTVEINSTFYRPPNEFLVRSWIKKASDLDGFEFSLKLPRLVTHDSIVKGNAAVAANQAASFESICVEPLATEGLLGCVLVQLSPYFKNEGSAIKALASLLDVVSCDKYPYAVEFRHRSWLDDSGRDIVPEALDLLQNHNVADVIVDGPGFPITSRITADHSYLRFHGRNYDIWYSDESEDDYRLNRYDFLYSEEQLGPWVQRMIKAEDSTRNVRVYFNNHGRSKAVKNAFQMMDLLSIPHREKEIQLQDQMTLGSFNGPAAEGGAEDKNGNLQIPKPNMRLAKSNR
jgi:uncharacterized protein YecE (DUF72 family)